MMIPNGNYLKFFPDAELPEELPASTRSGCRKIGVYLVIRKVMAHYRLEEKIYISYDSTNKHCQAGDAEGHPAGI